MTQTSKSPTFCNLNASVITSVRVPIHDHVSDNSDEDQLTRTPTRSNLNPANLTKIFNNTNPVNVPIPSWAQFDNKKNIKIKSRPNTASLSAGQTLWAFICGCLLAIRDVALAPLYDIFWMLKNVSTLIRGFFYLSAPILFATMATRLSSNHWGVYELATFVTVFLLSFMTIGWVLFLSKTIYRAILNGIIHLTNRGHQWLND